METEASWIPCPCPVNPSGCRDRPDREHAENPIQACDVHDIHPFHLLAKVRSIDLEAFARKAREVAFKKNVQYRLQEKPRRIGIEAGSLELDAIKAKR
nr:hypothetical protein [Bradyrhizobium sediminis]